MPIATRILRRLVSWFQTRWCRRGMAASPGLAGRFLWGALLGLAAGGLSRSAARAGDWPQILGPDRSGIAQDEVLPDTLPSPPNLLWSTELGQGFAGAAVVGDRCVVFHRLDEQEVLQAHDVRTGKQLWKTKFPANFVVGIDPDVGPRCVPVVHGQTVLALGAAGALHAVRLTDGQTLWSRDLLNEFQANEGYFGFGSSPLVVGELVIANIGGRPDAGIVALELASGKTRWTATRQAASYASPILVGLPDQPSVLCITRLQTVLLDPASGRVLAEYPFGDRGATVNAATPVRCDGDYFLTASYGIGARLLRLDAGKLQPVWENDDSLSSQYNTPIYVERHLYGIHGREDVGRAELRCIDAATGQVRWSEPDFGTAHLILAGNQLLALRIDGTLVMLRATPDRYTELSRVRLDAKATRALPALSNGRLFVRSTEGKLMCVGL